MGNSKDISVENSDARQKGRKRIEFRAKSIEELWALAEISKEKGEIFDAIAIYEVMLEKSPQNPAILLQLANTRVIVGHLDRARQLCARLNYSQMPVDMLEILLQLYAWELSDRDGAIQVAKRILELDPSSEIVQQVARGNIPEKPKAAILNSEGIVLYWNGHSTQAEYKFREAL